jgi:hypothetical protein
MQNGGILFLASPNRDIQIEIRKHIGLILPSTHFPETALHATYRSYFMLDQQNSNKLNFMHHFHVIYQNRLY